MLAAQEKTPRHDKRPLVADPRASERSSPLMKPRIHDLSISTFGPRSFLDANAGSIAISLIARAESLPITALFQFRKCPLTRRQSLRCQKVLSKIHCRVT